MKVKNLRNLSCSEFYSKVEKLKNRGYKVVNSWTSDTYVGCGRTGFGIEYNADLIKIKN